MLFLILGCAGPRQTVGKGISIKSVNYIGAYNFSPGYVFDSTVVGGLSGIDYDPVTGEFFMIADDPSTKGPARFYTAEMQLSDTGFVSVRIKSMTPLRNPGGETYSDIRVNRLGSADVEAMRYDGSRKEFAWSSEGQRIVTSELTELQQPAIVFMDRNGMFKDSIVLPPNIRITATEKGLRHNSGFEGMTYDEGFRNLYVSIEDALYEDGPRAGTGDSTALVRILKFDAQSKKPVAQYAYEVDPVPHAANPPGAFKINGISDILHIGNDQLLVMERAWSTGRLNSDVRIYLVDLSKADDVSDVESLISNHGRRILPKRLLLDMNSTGIYVDNMEGMCLGPKLPNGNQSLLVIVDNNFSNYQHNEVLLFELR